jgi:hypothetical protein
MDRIPSIDGEEGVELQGMDGRLASRIWGRCTLVPLRYVALAPIPIVVAGGGVEPPTSGL